jgi:hypothetical protein
MSNKIVNNILNKPHHVDAAKIHQQIVNYFYSTQHIPLDTSLNVLKQKLENHNGSNSVGPKMSEKSRFLGTLPIASASGRQRLKIYFCFNDLVGSINKLDVRPEHRYV